MTPLHKLGNGTIRASILALILLATAMLASSPTAFANTTDYDADNDNLIEITTHAQLNAVRWDADGDGSSTNAGYATAFPNALTGMGCAPPPAPATNSATTSTWTPTATAPPTPATPIGTTAPAGRRWA